MNVIVEIEGREAIPVRAIALLSDREVQEHEVVAALAWEKDYRAFRGLVAYELQPGSPPRPLRNTFWRNTVLPQFSEDDDRGEPTRAIPAGTFVWRDEFEPRYVRQFNGETLSFIEDEHVIVDDDVDARLEPNYQPLAVDRVAKVVMEGFEIQYLLASKRQSPPPARQHPSQHLVNFIRPGERAYGRATAEFLMRADEHGFLAINEAGVQLSEACQAFGLPASYQWKFLCDLDDPDGPDPLEEPALRVPFSGRHLAAFMLHGPGCAFQSRFGALGRGPVERELEALGPLADKPRWALRDAYSEFKEAARLVGDLNPQVQSVAAELKDEFEVANLKANEQFGVFAPGITQAEARARRVEAKRSIADLANRLAAATRQANIEETSWRRAMVKQLVGCSIQIPVGDKYVPIADIASLMADAVIKPRFDPGVAFEIGDEDREDEHALESAYRSEQVHVEQMRRDYAAKMFSEIRLGRLSTHLADGRPCTLEDPRACISVENFATFVRKVAPGMEISIAARQHPKEPSEGECLSTQTASASPPAAEHPKTTASKPKLKLQEDRILEIIKDLGFTASALPERQPGKEGPKAQVRARALKERALFTLRPFTKAWKRLRDDGRIGGAE